MATVTLKGTECHTIGNLPPVNSQAPDFTVTKNDLGEIHLKNFIGKKIVLNIFPSLDTATCAAAMKRFNEIAATDPNNLVLCVSADLPFAQQRFCTLEHLANVMPGSIFRHPNFGKDYGVLITDGPLTGLLARAVVVIDEKGTITYTQLVKEISHEPNYEALLKAL
jgi:thiol peroxidase